MNNPWKIIQHLTSCLEFKDHALHHQFNIFKIASSSSFLLLSVAFVQTSFLIHHWYFTLANSGTALNIALAACCALVFGVFYWILVLFRVIYPLDNQATEHQGVLSFLENTITISTVLIASLILVLHVEGISEPVIHSTRNFQEHLQSESSSKTCKVLIFLCLLPIQFITLFPFCDVKMIWLSETIRLYFLCFFFPTLTKLVPPVWLITLASITSITLVLYRLQELQFYYSFLESEKEQKAMEIQAATIGICAMISHDFKTVMSCIESTASTLFHPFSLLATKCLLDGIR